jgi:hypothetical protein
MRGVIRKCINIDSIFWIIALSAFLVVMYVLFSMPQADAITRAEYEELKIQEDQAREDLKSYETQLSDQRELIKENNAKLSTLKEELKDVNGLSDWESLRLKLEYEAAVNVVNDYARELRTGLGDILTLKSDSIKFLKSLNLNGIIIDGPKPLSHLTTKIGVSLSKSCEIMIKNGFESNCPSYKQLIQLDSSNTDISGKFTTDDDGFFHRGDEPVQDSYKYYWNDEQIRIFVDPPGDMANRIKMIYIQPNFDDYTVRSDRTVNDSFEMVQGNKTLTLGNQTKVITFDVRNQTSEFGIIIYHDRYIERCNQATINANNWKFLLPDTIHLMRNDCDRGFTAFEEREVITPNSTDYSPLDSPEWNILQEAKRISEFCIFKYKACT